MLTKNEVQTIINLHENHSIYTPWADAKTFHRITKELAKPFLKYKIDKVIGIESRGFIFASVVAYILKAGLVVIRKQKKESKQNLFFNYPLVEEKLTDYSKQKKTIVLENNPMAILKKDKILVVDDWFGTGEHAISVANIIKKINRGKIIGFSVIYNSMSLEKERKIQKIGKLHYLIKYNP